MLTVGDKLPNFEVTACVNRERGLEFASISPEKYRGKWLVLFSWPMDFTFVCPTEIQEFSKKHSEFSSRNAVVLGLSTDSEFVHLAWRNTDERLNHIEFPMLADVKRELCQALGILHHEKGVALRATFICDPEGIIRHVSVHDLSTGRSVSEVIRTLDALQTGELCPVNWERGQETLHIS